MVQDSYSFELFSKCFCLKKYEILITYPSHHRVGRGKGKKKKKNSIDIVKAKIKIKVRLVSCISA